ncbi:MAG: P-loop NTPase [Thiotrichales bacterium]|nr:P-loop NTPase [Thiotrichales bacterium]
MRIVIISAQETFRDDVHSACVRFTESVTSIRIGDTIGQGLDLVEQLEAEVVFIDLTHNIEAAITAIEQLSGIVNRVVVVSCENFSTDLMTRAINSGAREVLQQPVNAEEVHKILSKAMHFTSPDSPYNPNRSGKLIVSFSSKGGVGKTTTACNLAVGLATTLPDMKIGLVDANQQVPNVAPMLDLRPDRWFRHVVEEYKRIDTDMIDQFLSEHESGVYVLPNDGQLPSEGILNEDQVCKILLICKGKFSYTVVDTFPLLTSLNLAIMDLADKIFLITEAVVPSVRTARYNLDLLKQAGYDESRIDVIINRYTSFRGNITPDMVSDSLNWPVKYVIPYDRQVTVAANEGTPLVMMSPDNPISQSFYEIIADLTGKSRESVQPEQNSIFTQVKSWLS